MSKKNALWYLLAIMVVFAMVLSACQPAATEAPPEPEMTEEPAPEPEEPEAPAEPEEMPDVGFPVIPGGFLEKALAGEYAGTTVTVDGPFTDPDDVYFAQSMEAFEDATGITVNYIGDKEFEGRLSIAVDAGDPPDIADFPQPGLLANFTRQGLIVDPTSYIPQDWLEQQYNQSWLDMGTMEGQTAGVWHRFNGKSLVWYPKDDFDAAGYEIPETWDELLALTQMIADDGDTAWCIGIESGAATGWAATDWTEEMMLRTTSLENYDAWVAGELPFSSPEVKNAIETWSEIWFNPDYVFGGTGCDRLHLLWRLTGADVRGSAALLAAPAGQLHHRLLPRGRRSGRGLRLLLPAAGGRCLRQAVPGCWRHHGPVQRPARSAMP